MKLETWMTRDGFTIEADGFKRSFRWEDVNVEYLRTEFLRGLRLRVNNKAATEQLPERKAEARKRAISEIDVSRPDGGVLPRGNNPKVLLKQLQTLPAEQLRADFRIFVGRIQSELRGASQSEAMLLLLKKVGQLKTKQKGEADETTETR